MLLLAACGHARESAADRAEDGDALTTAAVDCAPAAEGRLEARLQGDIDAEVRWGSDLAQCRGSVRPHGDGLRLIFRGDADDSGPLLIVFGLVPLRPGESARNVPANLTLVREGTGRFYATQGPDRCAFDSVRQLPVAGEPGVYRLEGRGYCTQPARALVGEGAVLVSRFDLVAIIDDDRPGTDVTARAEGDRER